MKQISGTDGEIQRREKELISKGQKMAQKIDTSGLYEKLIDERNIINIFRRKHEIRKNEGIEGTSTQYGLEPDKIAILDYHITARKGNVESMEQQQAAKEQLIKQVLFRCHAGKAACFEDIGRKI